MKHTLVAAFATLTDANRTRGDLMARGIPREQIHAVGAESADIHAYDAPYSTSPDVPVDRHEHESKVAHFFKSLFGHEPHEQHRHYATAYPDAVRRGALVIAVDVVYEDQLARARDALEYNGAIDIDEHGGSGTADGYPGPSSPYAGATGGDSHLTSTSPDPQAERRAPPPAPACTRPANASVTTPAPALRLKSVPTPLPQRLPRQQHRRHRALRHRQRGQARRHRLPGNHRHQPPDRCRHHRPRQQQRCAGDRARRRHTRSRAVP